MTLKKRISTFLLVLVVILAIGGELLLSLFAVRADAAVDIQSYDSSPIESDMANMEEAKYPANQFGECEVVGFMEYCYSENSAYSSVYGLYVYVYNPTEKPLIMREGANEIQIATAYKADGTQNKVEDLGLTYLDNTDNYRFYKFKITDSSRLFSIAKDYAALWNGRRRYEVTAINMMFEGSADNKTFGASRIYEFTGYAAWCGEPSIAVSTLECQYYGGQSVHLQVYDTNYRFGHKGNNLYDDLQSVYFSLPNEYYRQWGNLSKITAEWYQYKTSPMFVTKDTKAYSALFDMRNKRINEFGQLIDENGNVLSEDVQSYWRVFWEETRGKYENGILTDIIYSYAKAYNAFCRNDIDDENFWDSTIFGDGSIFHTMGVNGDGKWNPVFSLDWIFPITKEIESLDDYRVSSEEVKKYIKDYTNAFPSQDKIQGKYASNLFERYDGDGYKSNSFEVSDVQNYVDKNDNQSFWEKLWGMNETTTDSYSPIVTISQGDLYLSAKAFSDKYFVNKDNAADIIEFAKNSYEKDETPVLLRFAKTDYYVSNARFDYAEEDEFDMSDVDGYVAQEYVFLNFDILSLEYTSADGFNKTVVGVVADSIDIINGLTAPEDAPVEEEEWWQKIMFVLGLILVIVFIDKIIRPIAWILKVIWSGIKVIFSIIWWIVTAPFRLIAFFFK